MINSALSIAPELGLTPVCHALGVSRATVYRREKPTPKPEKTTPDPVHPRRIPDPQRSEVLGLLNETRFVDLAPAALYATLLDQGTYLCSVRSMYRILKDADEVRERRNLLRHPVYTKPELLATGPNQVWSWDITKIRGPAAWTYYHLYVVIDIFSRYVVGWMIANNESAQLASELVEQTARYQNIAPDSLTIHADRGPAMTSKALSQLMDDLGIKKSHSRPYNSNDNPFSEAQFKTMKYRPEYPDRFGCIENARDFGESFFRWYNTWKQALKRGPLGR